MVTQLYQKGQPRYEWSKEHCEYIDKRLLRIRNLLNNGLGKEARKETIKLVKEQGLTALDKDGRLEALVRIGGF